MYSVYAVVHSLCQALRIQRRPTGFLPLGNFRSKVRQRCMKGVIMSVVPWLIGVGQRGLGACRKAPHPVLQVIEGFPEEGEGTAKFQFQVSENKNVTFFKGL